MKRSYTTMATYLKAMAKGKGYEHDYGSYIKAFASSLLNEPTEQNLMSVMALQMDRAILEGNAQHIFLPGLEFCEWLVSCVPSLESEHAKTLQQSVGDWKVGVIHFPTTANKISAGFGIGKHTVNLDGSDGPDYGCLYLTFSRGAIGHNVANASISLGADARGSATVMWYAKLIVGLGMYIHCFPDAMKDGPPEDLKHPAMHSYKNKITVSVAEKVRATGEHGSPTPHFRTGHFRVLRSEKFTQKRFQVVWVREAFVKGHAKTVLAPEEVAA